MLDRSATGSWGKVGRKLAVVFAGLVILATLTADVATAATTPAISLSPSSGAPGTKVAVAGSGFAARTKGAVRFAGATVGTFKTDGRGRVSATFTVPQGASAGTTQTTASAASTNASAPFAVATTAPPTSPTSPPSSPTSAGFVGRNGTAFTLDGAPYRFTGVNAYHLASDWNLNYGCGESNSQADLDATFSSMRPNSMVRFWAFQQLAWDKGSASQAFTTLDRVVATAEKYGQKLVVVLGDQWGNCGETTKSESWYGSGYKTVVTDGSSIGKLTVTKSYLDWVRTIVPRYASSPAVAMWEPMNEPATTADSGSGCTSTSAQTLRNFFDTVGGEIHKLDAKHLVASGVLGSGQCGAREGEFQSLHQSAGIDVGTYHDYSDSTVTMPGDQWNGLKVRLNQLAQLGKPLFIEEAGMNASADGNPMTLTQRRDRFKAKMDAQLAAGAQGYLPWYRSKSAGNTNYNIAPGDPTLDLLKAYSL